MGCGASAKYKASDSTADTAPPAVNGETKTKDCEVVVKRNAPSFHNLDSRWEEKDHLQFQVDRGDDIHETVDEIPKSHLGSEAVLARRRHALSAEAFGDWNVWQEFHLSEVEPKTVEQAGRIKEALLKSPLLRPLATRQEDLDLAISAFSHVQVSKGQEVITQGTPGTDLFLLESGTLEVFVRSSSDQPHPGVKVATFDQPGKEFGELALLHNAPRVATIIAKEPCTLWSISRHSFNIIMRDHSKMRHERHMGFLRSVKLLEPLDTVQIARISDAVSTVQYKQGDFVCREGEIGDCFYMVEEGEAMARINGMDVRSYKKGGYFGELSLINDRPRAADIVAASKELHLVSLDRESFTRLLGDKALFNRASITAIQYPIEGTRRKSVTFAPAGDSADAALGEAKPKIRKRGTGFIDRAKLVDLLAEAGEEEDEDDEEGGEARASLTSTASEEIKNSAPTKKVGFNASPGEGVPKLKKQGTGFIHAAQLRALLQEAGDEEDEDEDEDEKKVQFAVADSDKAPEKVTKRAGTGFISAEQLKKLLENTEEDDEEEEEEPRRVQFDASPGEGAPKAQVKRGTGFIHVDMLKKLIDEDEDEDDEDEHEEHKVYRGSAIDIYVDRASLRKTLGDEYDVPDAPADA